MNQCRYVVCLLLVVVSAVNSAIGDEGQAKPATDEQIAALIAQLGSDDFAAREQAQNRLAELEEALPALRAAVKSQDPEVRRAALELVGRWELRLEERFIREAVARVNDEGLDVFIDRMVLQNDYVTEARWKGAVEVARALAKRAARHGTAVPNILEQGSVPSTRTRVDGVANDLNVHGTLLFSSGTIKGINSTNGSILFVNGDINSLNSTTDSIIFCNGTIKSFNYTKGCIIFCNGVVESMNCTENNAVFVRGELRSLNYTKGNVIEASKLTSGVNVSEGNTYLNRKPQDIPRGKDDRFMAAEPSVLELFRFFDPARVGLEFTMIDGDAQVDAVTEGQAFARAGLRKGDRVLAVDQEKFLAADTFTRLLRRKMVAGKALLKVQRGDRVVEVAVSFLR
jgi:hypothetical protein